MRSEQEIQDALFWLFVAWKDISKDTSLSAASHDCKMMFSVLEWVLDKDGSGYAASFQTMIEEIRDASNGGGDE